MPDAIDRLGSISGVEFRLAVTGEPWTLPIDALVVSVSPSGGLGLLAQAVDDRFPDLNLAGRDLSMVTPRTPLTVRITGRPRPVIILANVRPDRRSEPYVPPADLGTVDAAVRASLVQAGGRVALPLLGSGGAGLPLELVAETVVKAAVTAPGAADEVIFVCVDDTARRAVRSAWLGTAPADDRPEPTRGGAILLDSAVRRILDLAERVADRYSGDDAIFAALLARGGAVGRGFVDVINRRDPVAGAVLRRLSMVTGAVEKRRGSSDALESDDSYEGLLARAAIVADETGASLVGAGHLLAAIVLTEPLPEPLWVSGIPVGDLRAMVLEAVADTMPSEDPMIWEEVLLGAAELEGGVSRELVDPSVGIPLGEDRLGFANYVAMLAMVVARKDTPLPLSVGLFGEWGSGKSYFMALLRGEIDVLARSGNPAYHRDVVQIGFNAWHYSDTDLWASLGNTIFERLAGPQETIEERRAEVSRELAENNRRRHQLDAATVAAEEQAAALRKRIEESRLSARFSLREAAIASAPALEEVWSRLGITDALAQGEVVLAEARGVRTELDVWRRVVAGRWWLAVAALLLVLLPVLLVVVDWDRAGDLTAAAVAAAGSLSLVVTGLRRASSTLRTLTATAETIRDEELREPLEELRRAEAEQLVLQAQLDEVVARVGELGRELAELSPGQRLYSFVSERAASDDYRARLGLVSTVRHDLQRLADLMTRWREDGGPSPRPIDRIVLYIDDLDRCSSRQVVDVLQAVHLLLALDLFVVVLGVDPRVLRRSIELEMPGTFGEATPLDYLEKIFNIPFVLPAMEPAGFDALIRSLAPVDQPANEDAGAEPPVVERAMSVPEPGVQAEEGSEVAEIRSGGPLRSVPRALTDAERDMLASVAPLVRSPRQAKRLVNLYRMIRATRNLGPASRFLGTADAPGDYQAVVVLLGVLTAHPDRFGTLLHELVTRTRIESWPKLSAELAEEPGWRPVMDALDGATERVALPDLTAFRHWAPHVARFSFVLSGVKQ